MARRRRRSSDPTYVVFVGRRPGFYSEWCDCHRQVDHFSGNAYCRYPSREEAEIAWINYWNDNYNPEVANNPYNGLHTRIRGAPSNISSVHDIDAAEVDGIETPDGSGADIGDGFVHGLDGSGLMRQGLTPPGFPSAGKRGHAREEAYPKRDDMHDGEGCNNVLVYCIAIMILALLFMYIKP